MASTFRVPHIFAVGGAHIDRRGRMTAEFVAGASIPGTMREDVGGGTFNALRTAVRRGARGTLMSVRGGDGAGMRVAETMAAEGIADASAIFLDRATPSYTALLDREGDVVAALADMDLYDTAFPKQMRRAKMRAELRDADALLTDANLPDAALERLTTAAAGTPVFAIAISPAKAVRLAGVMPKLSCLFMNRREAVALLSAIGEESGGDDAVQLVTAFRRAGLGQGVISEGERAVVVFDQGRIWRIVPPKPGRIADVTGAGDALAGASVAALLKGMALPEAVRDGLAAAHLAIGAETAVPAFDDKVFESTLALVPAAVEVA